MEFVTIRDLRLKPADVWDKLRQQREIILTSNGRPVAVIAGVGENDVEETVTALRRRPGAGRGRVYAPGCGRARRG